MKPNIALIAVTAALLLAVFSCSGKDETSRAQIIQAESDFAAMSDEAGGC